MFRQDTYEKNVCKLISFKYPRIHAKQHFFLDMIINQLAWVQESTEFTPQADVVYQEGSAWPQHLHREIFRALSRIECMLLLRDVNDDNFDILYKEFTVDQSEDDRLSKPSFRTLSETFKALNDTEIDAQVRSSLIASITLSPQAKKFADEAFGNNSYPYDSVMFSGKTVTEYGEMYPVYSTASEAVKSYIRACFPNDSRHWRHAFFLENAGCLDALIKQVKASDEPRNDEQLKKELTSWLNYWVINALGFNGHTNSLKGSSFMTESVFQRAKLLNATINNLFDHPDYDVFTDYSQACLQHLDVTVHNPKIALLIVRLLNMANIFNRDNAIALNRHITEHQMLDIVDCHGEVFKQGKVVTYLPGFLQNVCSAAKQDGTYDYNILLKAIKWASDMIQKSESQITSFRLLDKAIVKGLIDSAFSSEFTINAKGEVCKVSPPNDTEKEGSSDINCTLLGRIHSNCL